MRIYILIFFFIPCALLAQDTKVMTTQDALINAVLTNTANYLEHKNDIDPAKDLNINTKSDSIDWNNKQLIKWQIIEPKDSLKITYDD
jgi:hypothetical protein